MATAASTTSCALASPAASAVNAGEVKTAVHSVGLPALPPPPNVGAQAQPRNTSYCRKVARNVVAMAVGEPTVQLAANELPEIVKNIQEAWDKIEDKYAVTSLGIAGAIAMWSTGGMISAVDKLPLVPGVMELVGIGYTGWFAYRNLVFKPDRQALFAKIKNLYNDVLGSS